MARRRLPPPFAVQDPPAEPVGTAPVPLRPPVARVAAESAAEAALRSLSQEMQALRDQGRLVLSLPLEAVAENHLLRDRLVADPEEFEALKASIRAHGQRTPVEVCGPEEGRYGLISGWRRLHALRALAQEDPGRFGTVLALLRSPEDAAAAYVAMVEENEIRAGLSYWERARIALQSAAAGVFPDRRAALRSLFAASSRARRSKIGAFIPVVEALEGVLVFPTALGERAGLSLSQALAEDPGLAARLRRELAALPPPATPEEELARLQKRLAAKQPGPGRDRSAPRPRREEMAPGLWAERRADGALLIGGPGLSPELAARVTALLREAAAKG